MNLLTLIKYRKGWFRRAKFKWFDKKVITFCVESNCVSNEGYMRYDKYSSYNILYKYRFGVNFDNHRLYRRIYTNKTNYAAAFFLARRIANNDPNALFWWKT